jgi:uncharacterized protein
MSSRKLLASAAVAGFTMIAMASPAFAHVSVDPTRVVKGSEVVLTFHVPNESETATTTKIEMQMPKDNPFGVVSVQPVAGWTATATTSKLDQPIVTDDGTVDEAVTSITWDGGAIKPGDFEDFEILVGPIPTTATSLTFPTVQTYDDGTSTSWVEVASASGAAPEHPAPEVLVVAQQGSGGGKDSNTKTLAIAAAAVAGVALVVGAIALFRTR